MKRGGIQRIILGKVGGTEGGLNKSNFNRTRDLPPRQSRGFSHAEEKSSNPRIT